MKTLKSIVIAILLTVGSLTFAKAQTVFHVGVGGPGFHVSVGNAPYYHHYYAPAPVYVAPAPAYYGAYYGPAYHYHYWRRPYYYGHRAVYRRYYR